MTQYNIKVVCRLRPLNKIQIAHGGECCVKYTDKSLNINIGAEQINKYEFAFDKVLPPETPQSAVYQQVAIPVLKTVMAGFNGTVFAYGQTGGGKTWTMEGPSHDDIELKGLIPRMMQGLFQQVLAAQSSLEFTIKCSYIQIYNQKIFDLLDPSKNKLQVKQDKQRGIFIQGCTQVYVASVSQMRNTMSNGSQNRKIAFTGMNERSSRSHSLFIVHINQKDIKKGCIKNAKLYFVDLAGSEKVGKTGVKGQQLEQAKNINKSLSCLGNVINALTSEKKEHIPYRDSKLTRILQQSLGGNSRTTLIINCSMCSYNDKQTLSTLRFGQRAKSIKNKAIINEQKSAKQLQVLLDEANKTISRLRNQLKGKGEQLLLESERQILESRIFQLEAELEDKSSQRQTSSIGDMEMRIKTLLIQNKHMQENYQKQFENLAQRNFKQQQTINNLIYKQNALEKLLQRLKWDLDYLRLNLKYQQSNKESIEMKLFETVDRVQSIISQFFNLMSSMKQKFTQTTSIQQIKDLVFNERPHKIELSLSEPNLHSSSDMKLSRGFEQISMIIKQKIVEDDDSQDQKQVYDSSTQFQTFINTISKQKKSQEELMNENSHLSKLLQQMTIKYNKLSEQIKTKQERIQQFCAEKMQQFEQHYSLQQTNLKMMDKKLLHQMEINNKLSKQLSEQKAISHRLAKIIETSNDLNERHRVDQQLKQYINERQKMFNQLYSLRDQLDQADITIKEKDDLIQSLKVTMKQSYLQNQVYTLTPQIIKQQYRTTILGTQTKNVVKPVRGGGIMTRDDRGSTSQQKRKSVLRNKLSRVQKKSELSGLVGSFKNFFL